MQNLPSFLLVGVLQVYLLVLFYTLLKLTFVGVRSKTWATTEGEIITSEAAEENRLFTGVIAKKQRVLIGYKYTVNGQTFEGSTISADEYANASKLWTTKNAERMLSKYPVSRQVTVYYDSDSPSRALLEPGVDTNLILLLLIALCGVLFLPVMLLLMK